MKISVVVPAYNVEAYLEESINTLLRQSVPPFEVIIINDGSTDQTGSIADGLANNDNIRVVHTKNRGLGAARNLGCSMCRGDYVYFFDSDDLLESNFIEDIEGILKQNNSPDFVFFSGDQFLDDDSIEDLGNQYHRGFNGYFNNGIAAFEALYSNNSLITSACLYISRRELWGPEKLEFKSILHEDEEILFSLFLAAGPVVVTDETFFHRRIRAGSIMTIERSSANVNGFREALGTLLEQRAEGIIKGHDTWEAWAKRLQQVTMKVAQLERSTGHRLSIAMILQAILFVRSPRFVARVLLATLPKGLESRLRAVARK